MNPKIKLFVAVVLAGMFLLPPAAAAGGSDSPAVPAASEPASETAPAGERHTPMYLADLANGNLASGQTKGTPRLASAPRPENINVLTPEYGPRAFEQGRGPRAGPDIYVAARGIALEPPQSVRQWMGPGVYALKNAQTQINVTINNSGDADASPVTMVAKIWDFFNNEMFNQTYNLGAIAAGTNLTTYIYWTPTYCTYWELNLTLSTPGDTNPSNDQADVWNNGIAYLSVALWADSSDANNGWTGDIAANKWHITTTDPALDNATQHSAPACWYEGNDLLKRYENNMNVSVRSPTLDLRNFGKSWFLHFDYLFHGSLPVADSGDYIEQAFTADNGATFSDIAKIDGAGLLGAQADTGWLFWYTDINGDGQMSGTEIGMEISSQAGTQIQFRNRFISNAANVDTGLYFDDFCVWGLEIQADASVAIASDINEVRVSETKTITAKVTNLRQAQPSTFNCSINITRRGEPLNMLYNDKKTVNALAQGASQDITFSWTPGFKGDYVVVVNITGARDHDPFNNRDVRSFHVSGTSPKVLVVQDNPFGAPEGINTTDMIIRKLTEIPGYDDYGLYYTIYKGGDVGRDFTGDGPTPDIMEKYEFVVWTTGWDSRNESINGTLTANDQTNIKSYLAKGGSMWIISQGLVNDLYPNTFTSGTLHISSATNDTTIRAGDPMTHILPANLVGVPGSLAEGASFVVQPPPPRNWSWDEADRVKLDSGGQGLFYAGDTSDPTFVALQISGAYRMVFQTFDLAWITYDNEKTDYTQRVVSWLTGGLTMTVSGGGAPTSHLIVDPGGSAVYTLTITNGGTKARTLWDIDLTNAPSGWTAAVSPRTSNGDNPIDIASLESLEITLTVTAPAKALAGVIADIAVSMTFQNYATVLTNHTVTEVRAILGTELLAGTTEQNLTGPGTASYSFTLRNKGNMQIVVDLSKSGDRSEWITIGAIQVTLQPYEERLMSAVLTVPDGVFREAGNYTLRDNITARATYQSNTTSSNLSLTTRIKIAQIFSVKIDDFTLDPADGMVDMAATKPTAKLTVKITAQAANGYDNVTVELKAKSWTPTGSSQRSWDGTGWTLPKTSVATTPFMLSGKETGQLSIFVPSKETAGDYVIEVRATPGSGRLSDGDTTTITIRVAKPDLQVVEGSMSFSPKEPEVGTPVKIRVTVKNTGGVLARDVDVSFYSSGENLIETKRITSLAATTGSSNVEITWEGVALGDNEILVRVDAENKILELDDTNNEITDSVTGLRSDLVIDSAPLFYKEGRLVTKITVGDTVTIEVTVKNTGAWGLNLTGVKVQLTDQKTGEVLPVQTVSIPTRQELKVTFLWTVKKTGDHTFEARVNPDGANGIKEVSYDNDVQTATLKVVPVPPPPVTFDPLLIVGIVAVVAVVGIVAFVMMRRKPARPAAAPAPASETAEVVEAEAVEAPK